MDSYHNTNLPYTQAKFSSYDLPKSIGATKPRWISPSPKKKTMSQITASKKDAVKNDGTSNTNRERNSLKRKSSLAILDIDSKIKRLEALHEETTTSDSDTTITKIDRISKKRKLSKPSEESSVSEDLSKTLKSINNTVNQMTLLHPFSREEDIKIIRYFHKFMDLLAHKDDIYVYQLLEMKYHFQRPAQFLQDRFLNEILPNLYLYDCLSLEEMVIFYDRADMLVPKHVQNMIEEKVRSITGHRISSPESLVITISDSENEEPDLIENENIKSPCLSISSPIIRKRRNKVLQLSSSPTTCSTNVSENALETVQNTDKDSCNNSPRVMPESQVFTSRDSEKEDTNVIEKENIKSPSSSQSSLILSNRNNKLLKLPSSICSTSIVEKALQTVQNSDSDSCINTEVHSVNKEPNTVNVLNMWGSANHKSIQTCQLVKDSDLSKHSVTSVNFCDENNVKNNKTEHSDHVNRDNNLENIITNTCDTAEGSSDCIPSSTCLFETSEKQQVKCANHKKLVTKTTKFTKTVQSSNRKANKVTKSSQMIHNDQSHNNFKLHNDHTYVKLRQMIDTSLDYVSVQQVPDNTTLFPSEPEAVNKECISIKIPDNMCITKSTETSSKIQDSVKSINKRNFVNASTNTDAPVTINNHTQLSSFDSYNIDNISCLERDAIVLRMCGNSNIYVFDKDNVKKLARQYKVSEDSIHLTDTRNMEILQSYTNYKSYINSAIKTFTENNRNDYSRYNLRQFVKNPRGGTSTRRNIHWFKSGKRNVLDLLTNDCPSKVIKKPTRRAQRINELFGIRQLKLRESKLCKKTPWSPASDPSDETVSSATSSPVPDTSTTTNSDNKICTKPSSDIVIRRTYVKTNNKSTSNTQISTASPVTEEINKSESAVTSISSVSNKSACSDKPIITEIDTNASVAMLENNAISHISDVRNDYQKRICKRPESDIQINTISPSIIEGSNHSLSTVTSTTVTNKFVEDSNPENVIVSIKNNFEKRVYKKLESLYPISKSDSSLITEKSDQCASKKLVYIQINKNTGNILGLRPIRTSTDKKDISDTETSKAMSVIDNANGQVISESVNVTSSVSDSDKTVAEETISSTDSRVDAYYDMEFNMFEDLPCEYEPTCSWDGEVAIQNNQNLVSKPNEISRTSRNGAPDEYSIIKPTRTYTRKTARTNSTELNDSEVKLEPPDTSEDSGLEMIASQLLLGSPCARTSSSGSDDVILIQDSPNCILDFLVDDIKTEMEENTSNPLDPIYETVPVNKEDNRRSYWMIVNLVARELWSKQSTHKQMRI
ncbi:hypothetical protein CBL_08022 [Carabus blaptoides fortunei]